MRRIRELYWRPDRVERIYERHNVTTGEVEEALFGDSGGRLMRIGPAKRSSGEIVYEYYGRTEVGRYLMVALIYIGRGVAMPITARDMTRGERRNVYERGS